MFTLKSTPPQGKYVLITGASTGLGRETALYLAEKGFQVIGCVRQQEDGEKLAADCTSGRIAPLIIDVTDENSIITAAAQVSEKVGEQGLWGLVNNAGICISAPLECVSSDLLRNQLEVNLIGQLAVTRAMLPLLRRSETARLINVTSGLGTVAIPYLGAYSAAQFAKEGLSDALRRELAPMGIMVSVVSPGIIWTPIWNKIAVEGEKAISLAPDEVSDLYRNTYLNFLQAIKQSARYSRTTPAHVASAIFSALTSAKPKTRYRVGSDIRRAALLAHWLPDYVLDKMFKPIITPVSASKEQQHV
ncbi:SDR family NAD(P)-dependent oxidoreductase [Xenorhabdus sp. SGI246]|uniref:SDR family NAD(P)-dependent oxidoreductase n=1 Tax=Xenorhabdus sp. SGI246 TaxID=3158263 RepID=UPI00349F1B8F